jgi:aryl-alcohol dehydrogenase-like predicted oxidoreductase
MKKFFQLGGNITKKLGSWALHGAKKALTQCSSAEANMQDFSKRVQLGRSGLSVGRLGLGSSFKAGTAAYEKAFEHGANYFYWGSLRQNDMGEAIRRIAKRKRENLVVVVQSYARAGFLVQLSAERGLRRLGLDYADVLLLGWHNSEPWQTIMDGALRLVERGRVKHIALSSHQRTLFPKLLDSDIEIFHVRYNAVHRGAEREVFPALDGRDVQRRPGIVTYTSTRWGHLCDPKRTPQGERTPTGTDCYRFAMSDPHVDVAVAGPANPEQMDQALRALEFGPMSDEELAWMRRVGDGIYSGDTTSRVRD